MKCVAYDGKIPTSTPSTVIMCLACGAAFVGHGPRAGQNLDMDLVQPSRQENRGSSIFIRQPPRLYSEGDSRTAFITPSVSCLVLGYVVIMSDRAIVLDS